MTALLTTTEVCQVSSAEYEAAFQAARDASVLVRGATSPAEDVVRDAREFYLTTDGKSGFAIGPDGTLMGLFSLTRGRGDLLVRQAVELGARRLDCFDGYLPGLYSRHGFVEYDREPNWTPGGPDVVYMTLV